LFCCLLMSVTAMRVNQSFVIETQPTNLQSKVISTQETVSTSTLQSGKNGKQITVNDLLDAICVVESNCNSAAVGDGGASIGAYQIQRNYWKDAVEFDPSIGGVYEDVLNKDYARRVIRAYWNRYAVERRLGRKPTFEDMARIHNGGPNGYKKQATVKYWEKVSKVLYE